MLRKLKKNEKVGGYTKVVLIDLLYYCYVRLHTCDFMLEVFGLFLVYSISFLILIKLS